MRTTETEKRTEGEGAFTLLEFMIVIAIIAAIGGAAVYTYDRLDENMAKGRSTFDMAAIDRGVRLFKAVNGDYPQDLDLLTLSDTLVGDVSTVGPSVATTGGFFSQLPRELKGLDGDRTTSDGYLHFFKASSAIVNALAEAGMERVRGIPSANDLGDARPPNLAYNDPPTGVGTEVPITTDLVFSIIESKNLGAPDSGLLQAITGLDPDVTHLVVALGFGNNSSMVSHSGGVNSAGFSNAPSDSDVDSSDYGRFLLLFHLGSDADLSDTIEDSEIFPSALFIGTVDATGNWLEEQFKAAFDSKS